MINNKTFKQISNVLDSSSEAFMLVALVGLFALPFVIGANLSAGTPESESNTTAVIYEQDFDDSGVAGVSDIEDEFFSDEDYNVHSESDEGSADVSGLELDTAFLQGEKESSDGDVLGAATSDLASAPTFEIIESTGLDFFETFTTLFEGDQFRMQLGTNQVFDEMSLFILVNQSTDREIYKFDVNDNSESDGKSLYIDGLEYRVGTEKLPDYVTLEPEESVEFSFSSTASNTNVEVTVSQYEDKE